MEEQLPQVKEMVANMKQLLYLILILLRGESSGVIFLIKFIKFIVSSIFKLFLVKPFENVICVSGDPVTFATFD